MRQGPRVAVLLGLLVSSAGGRALADLGDCRQPLSTGSAPVVIDCLYVLQASARTATRVCEPRCICDVNGDDNITTTDALYCLRDVIGLTTLPRSRCSTCFEPLPSLIVKSRGVADLGNAFLDNCRFELGLSIFLAAGGRGWVSVEGAFSYPDVSEVSWTETDAGIAIEAGTAHGLLDSVDGVDIDVSWKDLLLHVSDTDGDGASETGVASVTISCIDEDLWFYGPDEFEVEIALSTDPAGPTLAMQPDGGLQPFYTFADEIVTRSSRPLLRETLGPVMILFTDFVPSFAYLDSLAARGPFVSVFSVDPRGPLPFGALIGLYPGDVVKDAWGNPARFNGRGFTTVYDPGPLNTNPSFEWGDAGWYNLATAKSAFGFSAVDGQWLAGVAAIEAGGYGDLIGYFNVPEGVTKLAFRLALAGYIGSDCSTTSVSLATQFGEQRIALSPLVDFRTFDIPWTEVAFDLTGLEGQRAVFRAVPSRFTRCLPDMYERLVLDDFRLE